MSSSASEMLPQTVLAKYKLVFQEQLNLPVCSKCGGVFKPSTIAQHLQKSENMNVNNVELKKALQALGVTMDFPPPPQSIIPPYTSLRIDTAWKCSLCSFTTRNQGPRNRQQHLTKHHQGAGSMVEISCQSFGKDEVFEVRTTAATISTVRPRYSAPSRMDTAAEIALLDSQPTALNVDITQVNNRQISAWLKTTGWHLYVGNHPAQPLLQWTDSPKPEDFNSLACAVRTYFIEAYHLIDETELVTKQILLSPDPQAE
ncbi:hypothetical protein FISHEDRAFT_70791 [Fistulina hepatica ATCC 64428]|uniref:C2H2-type domain-containing protein n=1 Tax=Fistulina hepatica ATCC 64428 TaxID=1128425 RepID=A0A0D7AHU2_9AGAR|nr:hypothetical protein FISHEDRAFT_70791 [Fistulina hepatica ATCC 64428]